MTHQEEVQMWRQFADQAMEAWRLDAAAWHRHSWLMYFGGLLTGILFAWAASL